MGEFPDDEEGSLFRLSDLEAAVDRKLDDEDESHGLIFGVDCARFGPDKNALAIWQGNELLEVLPSIPDPHYDPIRAIDFHTRTTSKFYGDDYAVDGD